jgi:LacI family transcriptional regulator
MENKVVTISHVAEKAGVSISTVSRALNNYSDISDKTKQRVIKIAEELGYKPNLIAKSLSSNKYFRFGMLIEDYDNSETANQFVFEVLMSFKKTIAKFGYEMILLSTTSDMQKTQNLTQLFQDKQIDGAFIMGLKMTDEYYKQLSIIQYPCVLFDFDIPNNSTSSVGVNNLRGAFLAVEHLIKMGHKKIGFINGSEEAFVSYERRDGYYLALSRYGILADNTLIINSDYTNEGGQIAARELMTRDRGITAIFCASDMMAIGAINMLSTMNINVPDDVSIVGFDDIYLAQIVKPKLTTIRQDREKIGEVAANILINLSADQHIGRVMLEPELVIRESAMVLKE